MPFKKILTTLLISIALLSQQVKGQQSSANKDELKEKAFAVLVSLAGEVNTLQSGENRARLGSNIADSVWAHDEQRARSLFAMVQSDIKNALQEEPGEDPRDILTYMVFMKLRVETVERIAKHDPQLAFEFLQSTKPNWSRPIPESGDDVQRTETRLAAKLANKHTEIALQLGREGLSRGFSRDLLNILYSLRAKQDPARVFYQEIVSKLRRVDIAKNWQTMEFVKNLGTSYVPPNADLAIYREFITNLKGSAAKYNCQQVGRDNYSTSYFCREMGTLLSVMERIERESQKPQESMPQNRGSHDFLDGIDLLDDDQTVEEILATAAANPDEKLGLYSRAVSLASSTGDFEQANKIIEEFNGSAAQKDRLKRMVEEYRVSMTLTEAGLAQVQQHLKKTAKPAERAMILIYLANKAGFTDRERALKFLDEARGLAEAMKPGKDQAEVLIQLARGYCVEKNDQGFEIVESLLPKLNELILAAMKLDGFDAISVREGEWNMSASGSVGDLLTKLSMNAPHFAWLNFDRALSMTRQFERPEIRMMAQLKLAQGILSGKQKRFDRPQYW